MRSARFVVGMMLASVVAVGCGRDEYVDPLTVKGDPAVITVTSPAFENGKPIPKKHTGEGEDVSPALAWSGVPEGAKELALICDDPDAPRAEPWVHWVVYGIPPDKTGFPEGGVDAAREGKNDFGNVGYGGPMPPAGHGVHHYHFRVYALDAPVDLKPGATKKQLVDAIKGRVIAQGELVGTYERKK